MDVIKKVFQYIVVLLISLFLLEIVVRALTVKSGTNVELFLNKSSRYLLPLPSSKDDYVAGKIAQADVNSYRIFDDTLGWSHAIWGIDTTGDFPCFANAKGLRISKKEWISKEDTPNHFDILTIGNSFTHGDMVLAEESWPYLLAEKTGKTVGNLGVGGYGLQQALLRLMTSGLTADTVIFGAIWSDFERAREPVFQFYTGGNKTRPVLQFNDDGLTYELINVPVLRPEEFYNAKKAHSAEIFNHIPGYNADVFSDALWTKSYLLRLVFSMKHQRNYFKKPSIYLRDDADLSQCISIFQLFQDYCNKNGMYPLVLLLDSEQNFVDAQKMNLSNPWYLVSNKLETRGIANINFHQALAERYKSNRSDIIHPTENLHYSKAGNKLVAELLLQRLVKTNN